MTKLSWTGFSKKTLQERKEHLKNNALLSQENQDLLDNDQQLTLKQLIKWLKMSLVALHFPSPFAQMYW